MSRNKFSVVENYPDKHGSRCGYCKSHNSSFSSGLWAHSMSVREYQTLIDRGWRRSGHYMYKPSMKQTCCPSYTIRCDVGDLQMSKSQKKVLKKFYNYLKFGDTQRNFRSGTSIGSDSVDGYMPDDVIPSHMEQATSEPAVIDLEKIQMDTSPSKEEGSICIKSKSKIGDDGKKQNDNAEETSDFNLPSTSLGKRGPEVESEARPQQRKAKLIRLENKYNKLIRRGMTEEEAIQLTYGKKTSPEKKARSFEDYFPRPEDVSYFTHKFRVDLHSVSELEKNTVLLEETHRLFSKYQQAVHGDTPEKCSKEQLIRFLVDSPLFDPKSIQAPPSGFGSFHQQYWLNDRLMAVGVIDILPSCVSSVYFFYDPDFMFLSLGTYGALQELYCTRWLTQVCPSIKFYYLGLYIHSCPKMCYKRKFCPSYLLCPETFTWHRIEKCLVLLEKSKYSRFEEDPNVVNKLQCDVDVSKAMVVYKHRPMGYLRYKQLNPDADDEDEMIEYVQLVGEDCCQNLLLYRS
ncbi:arginyl-tRNA--protein transferase 1 isoform X2 [Hetaerina americana]|uniref:arginyl-tRNA--protein transferase 1 isoform X2 n=1 Tax=Hetaerina americana TaxID=62018 RepID=UPI003A7F5198